MIKIPIKGYGKKLVFKSMYDYKFDRAKSALSGEGIYTREITDEHKYVIYTRSGDFERAKEIINKIFET